ncbi:MAG: hypothetical protein PWQ85_1533, partial [Geotoga sp.]|nr:hypothetical protein [Geotoga sp.]
MNEKSNKGFMVVVIFVFILPFIAFLLTSYSIYLKQQMNNLEISINDLKTSPKENSTEAITETVEIKLPKLEIKPNTSNIELQELNYYSLLQRSTNTLYQNNRGAVKVFETRQELLENAVEAYEEDILYYIFIN